MDDNFYEVVAVHDKGRVVIATDLSSEESDNVRRNYINKHGLFVHAGGRKVRAQINIYRQHHAHKEFEESYEEVIRQ